MFYVWLKFRIDKNEDTANIYFEDYLNFEFNKWMNYNERSKIISKNKLVNVVYLLLKILKSHNPKSQKDDDDLSQSIKQFNITRILKFVDEEIPNDLESYVKSERIREFLEDYNYLSSFIHGGAFADNLTFEENNQKRIELVRNFKTHSNNIGQLLRFFILYFLMNEDILIHDDIKKLIDGLIKK